MSLSTNSRAGAPRVRSYRSLSVRAIRARLEAGLDDAERVAAEAELARRGADDEPDTTFITGFASTGAIDFGTVESEPPPEVLAACGNGPPAGARPARGLWPVVVVVLVLAIAGGIGWALHAGPARH